MTLAFILICIAILFVRCSHEQHLRGYAVMAITGAAAAILIGAGHTFAYDSITVSTLLLSAWLTASLLWTDTDQSKAELLRVLSGLFLFSISRQAPMEWILWPMVVIGAVMAFLQIIFTIDGRDSQGRFPVFGNSNHNATILLVTIFSTLKIAYSSILFWPLLLVQIYAVLSSRCRGAIIALAIGLASVAVAEAHGQAYYGVAFATGVLMLACGMLYVWSETFMSHQQRLDMSSRVNFALYALAMIAKRPLHGWGLNMYKKILPDVAAHIRDNKGHTLHGLVDHSVLPKTHRVHNDHIELVLETGLIGYVLFAGIFASLTYSPVLFAFLVAMAINSMFFFTIRETHTSVFFWVALGALVPQGSQIAAIPAPFSYVAMAIALAVVYFAVTKIRGIYHFDQFLKVGSYKGKCEEIQRALLFDPYNGTYLCFASELHMMEDRLTAIEFGNRLLEHYEGDHRKWDILKHLGMLYKTTSSGNVGGYMLAQAEALGKYEETQEEAMSWHSSDHTAA